MRPEDFGTTVKVRQDENELRNTIKVVNRATKQIRTVLDGKYLYSYSDGDQHYQWSPDSRWLLVDYISVGGWNNSDVALVKADGSGEVTNLTESGYSDGDAKWVLDGKAMIWSSDRAGYRSHGSWGAERDIYIMFFDGEAYDKFSTDFYQNFPAIKTGDPLTAMFNLGGVLYFMTRRNKYQMYSQSADSWSQSNTNAQNGTFSQESIVCNKRNRKTAAF